MPLHACPRFQPVAFTLRLPDGSIGRASHVTPGGMLLQSNMAWKLGQVVVLELRLPAWRSWIAAEGLVALVTSRRGATVATIRFTRLRLRSPDPVSAMQGEHHAPGSLESDGHAGRA